MVKAIKIVAFGDSLTVGFAPSTFLESQPYSVFLQELADDFLERSGKKGDVEIRIRNKGINGDLTSGMLLRFRRDVINLNSDYVIILGGTNDLGWGFSVDDIFTNLKRMFDMARKYSIEPVACAVPSVLGWDEGIPPRLKLNRLLKRFCNREGIWCVDLFTETCDPETKRLRSEYSIDGLHLNTLGYRRMAETIFEESVRDIISRELSSERGMF